MVRGGACGPAARGGDLPAVTGDRSTLGKPGKTTQTHTTPRTLVPLIPWVWLGLGHLESSQLPLSLEQARFSPTAMGVWLLCPFWV